MLLPISMLIAPSLPAPGTLARDQSRRTLGLEQTRGIGDIIIALPIAKWYHDRGVKVYWPIDERFFGSFNRAVDYVEFLPFSFKRGRPYGLRNG